MGARLQTREHMVNHVFGYYLFLHICDLFIK